MALQSRLASSQLLQSHVAWFGQYGIILESGTDLCVAESSMLFQDLDGSSPMVYIMFRKLLV